MKRVCAWCRKKMKGKEPESVDTDMPVTHGICPDCLREMLSHEAVTLREYLDRFPGPVFLVDAEGRIVTANKEGLKVLNKRAEDIEGRLGGDAFECKYAKLPGGCGNTIHCKTCTIRITVTDTLETGQSHTKIPAYPDLHHMSGENRIRFLISTEKVGKAVLLRIDEISMEKRELRDACHDLVF
ncbi:MAG: hypothetical protein JRH13_09260 [Deltaproteobacteria bacterium]|nr:hypothetical protein [Deltaproteobacteria bacterium]MBW2129538.1 hypothetical protein [Deltaproteobacteria bacterium]